MAMNLMREAIDMMHRGAEETARLARKPTPNQDWEDFAKELMVETIKTLRDNCALINKYSDVVKIDMNRVEDFISDELWTRAQWEDEMSFRP